MERFSVRVPAAYKARILLGTQQYVKPRCRVGAPGEETGYPNY
jgi:hypothetical protein